MALSCKVGTFTLNTGTGNQSVTGVGFLPKAIIFWATRGTAVGYHADADFSIGFAVSSTSRATVSYASDDAVGTSDTAQRHDNTKALTFQPPASASGVTEAFDFVSLDSDGFTINVTTAGSALKINYLAVGGDDLTNVAIKEFTHTAGTGNLAVTGVGFQPDAAIFFTVGRDNAPPVTAANGRMSIGFTDGTNQVACGWCSDDNEATSDTARVQVSTLVVDEIFNTAQRNRLAFVSFDADGFTVNRLTSTSVAYNWALCLKGGQYKVGVETQKTSTGTKATTGVGFQPTGLLVQSVGAAASTSIQTESRHSFGAASGATARAATWHGDGDAKDTTEADSDHAEDVIITLSDPGTPTLLAEADLDSFDADGFTLDWTTADATAREFIYLAMGSEAGGGGLSIPIAMYHRLRQMGV